jgi:hypothetical protein
LQGQSHLGAVYLNSQWLPTTAATTSRGYIKDHFCRPLATLIIMLLDLFLSSSA